MEPSPADRYRRGGGIQTRLHVPLDDAELAPLREVEAPARGWATRCARASRPGLAGRCCRSSPRPAARLHFGRRRLGAEQPVEQARRDVLQALQPGGTSHQSILLPVRGRWACACARSLPSTCTSGARSTFRLVAWSRGGARAPRVPGSRVLLLVTGSAPWPAWCSGRPASAVRSGISFVRVSLSAQPASSPSTPSACAIWWRGSGPRKVSRSRSPGPSRTWRRQHAEPRTGQPEGRGGGLLRQQQSGLREAPRVRDNLLGGLLLHTVSARISSTMRSSNAAPPESTRPDRERRPKQDAARTDIQLQTTEDRLLLLSRLVRILAGRGGCDPRQPSSRCTSREHPPGRLGAWTPTPPFHGAQGAGHPAIFHRRRRGDNSEGGEPFRAPQARLPCGKDIPAPVTLP